MKFQWPWRSARRIREDVAEEFAFHVDARTAELVALGLDPEDARRRARSEFGDADGAATACADDDLAVERSRRRTLGLQELRQDFAFGVRLLWRRPGFTVTAAVTLAIGIGATTALFSAVYGVLLKPLPYDAQDQLVTIWQNNPSSGQRDRPSPGNFMDLRDQLRTIRPLAAAEPYGMDLTRNGDAVGVETWRVSEGFFGVLGVRPVLGRDFAKDEFVAGSDRVVLLSHGLWSRRFGADTSLIGRSLTLDGEAYQVVGVLPRDLRFPSAGELWVPRALGEADRARRAQTYYTVIGRLAAGTSLEAARLELAHAGAELAREYPRVNGGLTLSAISIAETISGPVREGLLLLFAAVGAVLLLACVNVAGLLFARGSDRTREFSVRVALGAGRVRLVRQLMAENLSLVALGSGLGLGLAALLVTLLTRLAPADLPRLEDIRIAGWPLLFATLAMLLTALACGLAPALAASRAAADPATRAGGTARTRVRELMVGGEVAVALALLVTAGLLLRSFGSVLGTDLGYATTGRAALTMHVWDRVPVPAQRVAFFQALETRLLAMPGVAAAGAASSLPLSQEGSEMDPPFVIMGRPSPAPGSEPTALLTVVTPGLLPSLHVPLRSGRLIDQRDRDVTPPVALINETMARRFWSDGGAIGSRIRSGNDTTTREVIGIVADTRRAGHTANPVPEIFVPHAQRPFGSMSVVLVSSDGDVTRLLPAFQRELWELLPGQTFGIESLEGLLTESLAARRFSLAMLAGFAMAALALAVVGIYGLMSIAVAQRTREIGVRIALGAVPSGLVGWFVRRGLALTGVGLVVGAIVALAAARLLRSMLFGVSPTDPATYAGAAILALVAAGIAIWLPARRAARVDPLIAMRAD